MKKGSGVIGCIVHGHSIAELANSVSNVSVLITYSKVTYLSTFITVGKV